jgi:hypothetical protein
MNASPIRIAAVLAGAAGAALLVAGLASAFLPNEERQSLAVNELSCAIGAVHLGETRAVHLQLTNKDTRIVTIIGAGDSCRADGCTQTLGLPMTIPPGGTCELRVLFKATAPGRVSYMHRIFYSADATQAMDVTIRGDVSGNGAVP